MQHQPIPHPVLAVLCLGVRAVLWVFAGLPKALLLFQPPQPLTPTHQEISPYVSHTLGKPSNLTSTKSRVNDTTFVLRKINIRFLRNWKYQNLLHFMSKNVYTLKKKKKKTTNTWQAEVGSNQPEIYNKTHKELYRLFYFNKSEAFFSVKYISGIYLLSCTM